eukprot:TRINITY_DN2005_c0_g1_i1.p1 TRINITY_DN2005_c0_g1~~TRINITY_DN2005_c0_g1_i1.p1  ORF type:complete len:126 (+),score=27.48 TRINITY_DN2005_c0_g1_i1:160-537(+)
MNEKEAKITNVSVNFDPALKTLLREARYFKKYAIDIPKKAGDIHVKSDQYKNQICQLQLITNKYNLMVSTLHEAERPLLHDYIGNIDEIMMPGLKDINWKQQRNVDEFIANIEQKQIVFISFMKP